MLFLNHTTVKKELTALQSTFITDIYTVDLYPPLKKISCTQKMTNVITQQLHFIEFVIQSLANMSIV